MIKYLSALDAVIEETVARWGIPGLGIAIVEGDDIVYARGFGVQSLETRAPVTPDSLFCVASVSKCFVAAAVMQLAERGRVDLDAPVVRCLPYFRLADERYLQITLRQVLSHTSGMPDMDEVEYDALVYHPETDAGAPERYVRGLAGRKLIAAPGQRFSYSNIGYNVLGDLIAKVSGQSFENFMKKNILEPAGMPDSTFFYPEVEQSRLAVPHLLAPEMRVSPVYPYHRADAPASFLHSSLSEMCAWGSASLARGTRGGRRFLSAAAYEQMWTPVAPRGYPPFYEDGGLGWTLGRYAGIKTVSHGGMGFGWADFFILLPEINRGAVLLCNAESPARDRLVEEVVKALVEREPRVGPVSWVVPVSQALRDGGIQAADACCAEIQERRGAEVYLDPEDLLGLAYQLAAVGEIDLAVDVLGLNLRAFPGQVDSLVYLARLLIERGERARAEDCLRAALASQPENLVVAELLKMVVRNDDNRGAQA